MMLALVHSPLTGPFVWQPAAQELARRGIEAVVPEVADHPSATGPFWDQESRAAARSLRRVTGSVVLVAHSGAGPLLPVIGERAACDVNGYLFVDAGLPQDGTSRLDDMRSEGAAWAEELERHLRSGGRFPEWTEDDLREILPLEGLRRGLLDELRPRPLEFFTEPIPVPASWPDAPCGYLRLSAVYEGARRRASDEGWPARSLEQGHFHMLVDPPGVVDEMVALLEAMSVRP
jgi:hypothetical protein